MGGGAVIVTNALTGNTIVDQTTAGVAASAVTSPFWLPWLHSASEIAAMVTPILGGLWLLVQIGAKVRETMRKDKEAEAQ